ncbi:MAG: DUF456 domain-containing protein [Methylibium sp.]|uniref:DUF456 domain-containing protein n=1 Tax=Methylibium sp. TaxID=2067992 RepID=UPI001795B67B|nr:DUF456 domain-containing protein [Methylibium sp.]MBA3595858.1 DUF456 domain-containing protein [Methylibium sp.]
MDALTTLLPSIPPAVWWALAVVMTIIGVAGTVLPVLPGTLLVMAGLFLGAWIDGFVRVSGWTVAAIAVLALLALAIDFVASVLGAQRVGASRWALIGAALGTVVGLFMGLIGVLFMPFVGAVAGELYALRQPPAGGLVPATPGVPVDSDTRRAFRVGTAAWIGMLVGTAVKLALGFVMIGVFVVALLW